MVKRQKEAKDAGIGSLKILFWNTNKPDRFQKKTNKNNDLLNGPDSALWTSRRTYGNLNTILTKA